MKKKLMSFVMAVVLCLGMVTTVSAAESPAPTTTLPVPTNLTWSDNWDPQWDAVPEAHGHYNLEVYKDGVLFFSTSWSMGERGQTREEANFSPEISESGSYTFRVASNNWYDPENTVSSPFSEMSEAKVYTRPAVALGTTVGYWDTEEEGIFYFNGVEDAGGYRIIVYKEDAYGNEYQVWGSWGVSDTNYDTASNVHKNDFTDVIVEEGKYRVTVQALSADIATIANGVEGEKSAAFDTTVTSDKVEETLNDLDLTGDPNGSLETVKEEFEVDELRTAMQTDEEVLAKMEELDDAYAEANGITVGNNVDPEVEALGVDSSKIDMVGAALNTGAGDVTLEMNVTPEEEKIDVDTNRYKNSVQLDLKLNTENGYKSTLEVPITITMPVPTGVDISKLTILHYCQDGTQEVISPKNNGDGTITFTVTKFSTFVFAEDAGTSSGTTSGGVTSSPAVETEHVLANGENVRMITVKGNSNVYVIGNKDYLPTGATFNSVALTSGDNYAAAAKAVQDKYGVSAKFNVFEMSLLDASKQPITELPGYINVTLPVPAGMADDKGETIRAYRLEANGKLTKLDTAVADGQVTFATNHFSTFVLVEESEMISPKTGENNMSAYVTLLAVVALAGVVVTTRKAREMR